MKTPISVHVVYHDKSNDCSKTYSEIYKLLCRNSRDPFSDGLDIPVYPNITSDDHEIFPIHVDRSERTFVLLLIDDNMYRSENSRKYVASLVEKEKAGELIIYPVALCKYAFEYDSDLQYKQFISLHSYSVLDCWDEFQTRLYDALIRSLADKGNNKVRIFISHSKKDKDNIGEVRAMQLRDYLRSETKLDSFFDVNDIMDGDRFDKQIEEGVENALLLILFSSTYSSREWCRREALSAKRNSIPTVAVFLINKDIDRIYPYIGNMPSAYYTDDWRPIVNLLLRTALDQYNERYLLSDMSAGDANTQVLPYPPEAYSFSILSENKNCVLYPEPPLGEEELTVLGKIKPDTRFVTPMQYSTQGIDLKQANIAISISESENIQNLGLSKEAIDDLMVEITRHLLISNAKMVYGGDLRQMGYTELFKDLAYQYGAFEKSRNDVMYFTDYVAWPLHVNIRPDTHDEYRHSRVNLKFVAPIDYQGIDTSKFLCPDCTYHQYIWAENLTNMRNQMEENVVCRIIAGGRTSGFKGRMAGVLEEFLVARSKGHPVYIVGGFGGCAQLLTEVIEGAKPVDAFVGSASASEAYRALLDYYASKGQPVNYDEVGEYANIETLTDNGLSVEDNLTLFHSVNIMEIVSLILKGLKQVIKNEA